jgi:uncharacterized protein YlxP (DUF503 family)
MVVGLLTLEVHLPYAQSLKDKRQVLRSLKDRLRSHFNVAVAEVDHQELWQRATLGVVSVSNEQAHVTRLLESAEEEAERILNGGLTNSEIEIY